MFADANAPRKHVMYEHVRRATTPRAPPYFAHVFIIAAPFFYSMINPKNAATIQNIVHDRYYAVARRYPALTRYV